MTGRRLTALATAVVLTVIGLSDLAIADDTPTQTPLTSASSTSTPPQPTQAPSSLTTVTSTDVSPSSTDATTVICAPTPPPGVTTSTTSPAAPASSSASPGSATCGTVPSPDAPLPDTAKSVEYIVQAFPGAAADSSDGATAELEKQVPPDHSRTRDLLQEKTTLPESMGGIFSEKPWPLPETDSTVKLDVTRDGKITKSRPAGPGLREYDGGEPGTRTVFQQLPGQGVRFYKIIEQHKADANAPTELSFHFEKSCSGGGIFSSTPKKCAKEQCTGWIHKHCTKPWVLSDKYSYIGAKGITLIDPNTASDVTGDGAPRGFLTAPVARDASRKPVFLTWGINGDTIEVKIYDGAAEVKHPVIVDPQWFVGRWLAKGALVAGQPEVGVALMAIGCAAGVALEWPETEGQLWYRRIWPLALACLTSL